MFTSVLQPTHLLIVLIVALVVLGPKRLPGAGRALGQGIKEFRSSISGEHLDQLTPAPLPTDTQASSAAPAGGESGNGVHAGPPAAAPAEAPSSPSASDPPASGG